MNMIRLGTVYKSLANEIADSAGFERAGRLEIFEFEEYAAAVLISRETLARKSKGHNWCL